VPRVRPFPRGSCRSPFGSSDLEDLLRFSLFFLRAMTVRLVLTNFFFATSEALPFLPLSAHIVFDKQTPYSSPPTGCTEQFIPLFPGHGVRSTCFFPYQARLSFFPDSCEKHDLLTARTLPPPPTGCFQAPVSRKCLREFLLYHPFFPFYGGPIFAARPPIPPFEGIFNTPPLPSLGMCACSFLAVVFILENALRS